MEFKFNVGKLLRPDADGFTVLDGSRGNPFGGQAVAQRSSRHFGMGNGPAASVVHLSDGE